MPTVLCKMRLQSLTAGYGDLREDGLRPTDTHVESEDTVKCAYNERCLAVFVKSKKNEKRKK